MGTDIHYFAERKTAAGNWELLDADFYFGDDRNYELFDILAGVRARGFEQITPLRGLPPDLLAGISEHPWFSENTDSYEDFCESYHSASWVLLQELIEFPWTTKNRTISGYVNAENYRQKRDGKPYSYRPVSPPHPINSEPLPRPDWIVVSDADMEAHLAANTANDAMHAFFSYEESYAGPGHWILHDTIPKLSKLGKPDEIRIVFYFDS